MAGFEVTDAALMLKLRLIVFSVLVVLSFFIFVSIGDMMDRFGGCPLFAEYPRYWLMASQSRCNFPMVIAILFQFLYLVYRLVLLILFKLEKLTEAFVLIGRLEIVYVLIDIIACFLTFIGACILSSGTARVCSHFNVCDIFDWLTAAKIAQAGAWISVFLWCFITVWEAIFVWKTGKVQNAFKRGDGSSNTTDKGSST